MSDIQTTEEVTELVDEQPLNAPEITENPSEDPAPTDPIDPAADPEQPSPEPVAPEGYVPKEKFVASSQESILNAARVEARDAQIEQLTKTDTPTDEAMRLVYPEWDELNDVTKKALIKQEAQDMRQHRIEAQQIELASRLKLDDELETVIDANPKLAGKEADFKRFAKSPKNKGISAETLAKAFLFDVEPEVTKAPAGEALPQGSGGPRGDQSPKKISITEAAEIRKTDNARYMELAKAGLIDEDID